MGDDWRTRRVIKELNNRKQPTIIVLPVPGQPDKVRKYNCNKRVPNRDQIWNCNGCHQEYKKLRANNQPAPTKPFIKVRVDEDGVPWFAADPDLPNHAHYCEPVTVVANKARQEERKMVKKVQQETRAYPKQVYIDHKADTLREEPEVHDAIRPFESLKSAVYRSKQKRFPVLVDARHIPDNLKYSLRDSLHPSENMQSYLMYVSPPGEPETLIFSHPDQLEILHQSREWMCDGTFDYAATGYSQLYSIHGFVHGESHPCVVALLPDKSGPTYFDLFSRVGDALEDLFGSVGEIATGTGNFDFEEGAYNHFKRRFRTSNVKGCIFHFGQCLDRNLRKKHLQAVYTQTGQYAGEAYRGVYDWVRQLVGLSMHHPDYVQHAWDTWLSTIPITTDYEVNGWLRSFRDYYRDEWMTDEKIPIWNHHWHRGPRTNNHVEGWHNSLKYHFGQKHPDLSQWLVEYQKMHYAMSERVRMLRDGHAPHRSRTQWVQNDAMLHQAIENFDMQLEGLDRGDYDAHGRPRAVVLREISENLLKRAGHLLGDHFKRAREEDERENNADNAPQQN